MRKLDLNLILMAAVLMGCVGGLDVVVEQTASPGTAARHPAHTGTGAGASPCASST